MNEYKSDHIENKNLQYVKLRDSIMENNKVFNIFNSKRVNFLFKEFDKKFRDKSKRIKKQTLTLEKVIGFIDEIKTNSEAKEKFNKKELETFGNESTQIQDLSKDYNSNKNVENSIKCNEKQKKKKDSNNNLKQIIIQNDDRDLTIINETMNDHSKITKSRELSYLISQIEINDNSSNMTILEQENLYNNNIYDQIYTLGDVQTNTRYNFSNNNENNQNNQISRKEKNNKSKKEELLENMNQRDYINERNKHIIYVSNMKKIMEKCKMKKINIFFIISL